MKIYILLLTAFVPLLWTFGYALLRFNRIPKGLKFIAYFLIFEFLAQGFSTLLFFLKLPNLSYLFVYAPVSLLLLVAFYHGFLKVYISGRLLQIAAVAFVAFSVLDALYLEDSNTFGSLLLTARSVILLILSLSTLILFMNETVRKEKQESLAAISWINNGVLLYHSSNLLLFYFGSILMHQVSPEMSGYIWVLHSFFASVMYICIFMGLRKGLRHKANQRLNQFE